MSEAPVSLSASAQRMRRHRERRRRGLISLALDVRRTEVDALVRKGFLNPAASNSPSAVLQALYAFLDQSLGAKL